MGHFIKLHELFEIVRQSSDPEFAQILNHMREARHTEDVVNIKKLAGTDTFQWLLTSLLSYIWLTSWQNKKSLE